MLTRMHGSSALRETAAGSPTDGVRSCLARRDSYEEWSAYGAEVPLVMENGEAVLQVSGSHPQLSSTLD
jgi:hypothetical protein